MDGLAEIVVDYLLTVMFASGDIIDPDFQCRLQESLPEYINPLSEDERAALSQAAQRRLDELAKGPDEYGYDQGMLVSEEHRALLLALASGDLYDGLQP